MKNLQLLLVLFFTTLFFNSCGDDPFLVLLDVEPPEHKTQLALHCYVSNKSSVLFAGLSETRGLLEVNDELNLVEGGTISLYQDGTKLFDYEPRQGGDRVNYEFNNANPFGIKDGVLEIKASAPGFPEMTATQSFPTFVPLTDFKFEENGTIDVDGSRLDAVELTFRDPPGEENFYEISMINGEPECGNFNSVYFSTQDLNASFSGDGDGILLSDIGFDGQEYKIILGIWNFIDQDEDLTLKWQCISKAHYNYSFSLDAFNLQQDFGGFSEPVPIFSNVDNGIGVFTCRSEEFYTILEGDSEGIPNVLTGTLDGVPYEPCRINARIGNGFSLNADDGLTGLSINIDQLEIGQVEGNFSIFYNDYDSGLFYTLFSPTDMGTMEVTAHDEDTNFVSGIFSGTLTDGPTMETVEFENLVFEVFYE